MKKIVVDVTAQRIAPSELRRQLTAGQNRPQSVQLSREQLALFAAEFGMASPDARRPRITIQELPGGASGSGSGKPRGRKPLPLHLKRERIEHDQPESEEHSPRCDQELRRIGEELSEEIHGKSRARLLRAYPELLQGEK